MTERQADDPGPGTRQPTALEMAMELTRTASDCRAAGRHDMAIQMALIAAQYLQLARALGEGTQA